MFLTPLYLSLPPIENEIPSHPLSLSLSLSKIQKQKHHSETEIIAPQKKKVFIFFSFLLFQKKLKNCDSPCCSVCVCVYKYC